HEFPHRSLLLLHPRPPRSTLFPYTTLFRSPRWDVEASPSLVYGARLLSGFGAQNPIEGSNPSASAASLRQQDRTLVPNGHEGSVDRKSTRLNSSHVKISYAVFCLKKKKKSK